MARENYTIEKGIRLTAENDATISVDFLFGSAAPGSTAQENNAGVGSIYLRTNGELHQKDTAGSGTDKWQQLAASGLVTFRGEHVKVVTNDTYPGDASVVSTFTDDDGGGPPVNNTGFAVNDFIIFDADGTPTLATVSAVAAGNITVTSVGVTVLTQNDTFVNEFYLPDPVGQEAQAIVNYNGSVIIKLADVNWNFADGINIAAGYTAGTGNPTAADTVQTSLQKIDGNVDSIDTRQGLVQGALNFGATAGAKNLLTQNSTTKQLLEDVEAEIDTYKTQAAVTAVVTLDSVPIANFEAVEWLIHAILDATPANRKVGRVLALHDGTAASADVVDLVRVGANFNTVVTVDVNAGNMRLRVSAAAAATYKSERRHIITAIN